MRFILIFGLIISYGVSFSQVLFEDNSTALGLSITAEIEDGTGISFCDFDNDGWDDITAASNSGEPIKFYKNNLGNGFIEVNLLQTDDPLIETKQPIWADIDNDGDKDLFMASETGLNKLYRNDNGSLVDITNSSGLPLDNKRTNCGSFADYDNDGYLDLFLANRDFDYLIPNMLFKNNGDGTFTDTSISSGIGEVSNLTFQGTFFDYNNDNLLDLYLINDRQIATRNILYKNLGNGNFEDVSNQTNTDIPMDAMSIAVEDYNYDGFLDMYITNVYVPTVPVKGNVLFRNSGANTFNNIALDSGVRFDSWSWGANWLDGDNDKKLDLYVSGLADLNTESINSAAFFLNDGENTFTEINDSGFENDLAHSYGNAIGDFNNDGYTDILVSNLFEHDSYLWENKSYELNNYNWFKINLVGTASNRDGIGARIKIESNGSTQYRVVTCGESYLSQNSSSEMFGLGEDDLIDQLTITWPSGIIDEYINIDPNVAIVATEGDSFEILTVTYQSLAEITLTPNPASTSFSIYSGSNNFTAVEIIDIQGRTIVTQEFSDTNSESLDVTGYAKGTYFVKILTENGVVTKSLLVD